MIENGLPKIFELATAEFWAKLFAEEKLFDQGSHAVRTPIQNFEFNILKAKVLHSTAENVSTIWQEMIEKMPKSGKKAAIDVINKGLALYFVYTEQALVSAVSASEVYFKDKLAYAIQNDSRLLNHYMDRQIKVRRILDAGLNLSEDIGILIVENMNFQILDEIQKEYKKLFGFEPFTKDELKKLKEIFAIRHVIVHKSGIVDHFFISETGSDYPIGKRFFFKRNEILQMIEFIEKIVIKIDTMLKEKLLVGEEA